MSKGQKSHSTISTQRLEAFSDGVFAIVITLLFINLKVPEIGEQGDWKELLNALYNLTPKFLGIAVSFFFVAIFWVAHHQFFHTLKETTRGLLWLNIAFLLLVCFVPFPAEILTEFPTNETAAVFFGLTVLLTGIMLVVLRWYAWLKHPEITFVVDDEARLRKSLNRSLLIVLFNFLGVIVSFFYPVVAILVYLLTPLALFIPIKVEVENLDEDSDEETNELLL